LFHGILRCLARADNGEGRAPRRMPELVGENSGSAVGERPDIYGIHSARRISGIKLKSHEKLAGEVKAPAWDRRARASVPAKGDALGTQSTGITVTRSAYVSHCHPVAQLFRTERSRQFSRGANGGEQSTGVLPSKNELRLAKGMDLAQGGSTLISDVYCPSRDRRYFDATAPFLGNDGSGYGGPLGPGCFPAGNAPDAGMHVRCSWETCRDEPAGAASTTPHGAV
jgi:hypothetical protein